MRNELTPPVSNLSLSLVVLSTAPRSEEKSGSAGVSVSTSSVDDALSIGGGYFCR